MIQDSMSLEQAINSNKRVRILAYSVSDYVEHRMKEVLELVFKKYGRPDMVPPVYTCVKELLINAVKANFKNIYFEGYSPKNNPDDVLGYELSLKLFKLELSRENAQYLEDLARKSDLKAEVYIQAIDDILHVLVMNPVEMTEQEKINVSHKLDCASRYTDITEYFEESEQASAGTNDEGAGLGIILISMMMRNMGASEHDFVITSENEKTTAYLKIPLGN